MRMAVMVNPKDLNLADAKAYAALYNVTVIGNPACPRGRFIRVPESKPVLGRGPV